jgi:hypothetical protein
MMDERQDFDALWLMKRGWRVVFEIGVIGIIYTHFAGVDRDRFS